jgi:hypothetical protein
MPHLSAGVVVLAGLTAGQTAAPPAAMRLVDIAVVHSGKKCRIASVSQNHHMKIDPCFTGKLLIHMKSGGMAFFSPR